MIEKENVLIIGINSFLGESLATQLYESNMHIIGVYHKNTSNIKDYVERVHVSELSQLTQKKIKTIYFVSAYISSNDEDATLLQTVNVALPAQVSTLFPKTKIVFASTVSVYGLPEKSPITERTETVPLNIYGHSKLAGEHIISNHALYAIVRISSIFGEGMKKNTFIPKIIEKALEERQIVLFGDGSRMQNYIHVADVAKYMILAAAHQDNALFLATSVSSCSNLEVAAIIAEATNATIQFEGNDDSPSFEYDNFETRNQLKYHHKDQIKKELTALIQCYKKQY
ncbi:MAG: NAD(P)-dependent oxidoreductase [Bacteroidota bacterium]